MKFVHIVLVIILATTVSYGTTWLTRSSTIAPHDDRDAAYNRVISTNTIRCGYAISPPITVKNPNSGKLSGLDIDIWEEIGQQLGLKIEWVEEVGWGNFIEGLRTDRYDAFCSQLWPETSRSKFLTMAGPILFTFTDTYVRAGDFRFDANLEAINRQTVRIPVVDGDISYEMANRFPQATKLTLPQMATVADMMESVLTGKADVLFFDQTLFHSFPADQKSKIRKVENVPHSFLFPSYYGIKAGEQQLRDIVSLAISAMIDDGRMEKLARKYSKEYILPNRRFTENSDKQ